MPYYAFVADLGGSKLSAAIVDQRGKIAERRTLPVDKTSALAPVNQIRQLATELAGSKTPKGMFASAAVAIPGLVRRSGTVWAPNLPGWENMPLASRLKRSLGIPVLVESDRNAAVLGEVWRGSARGKSDAIILTVGTGIGAGILSGGRLIRGAHELSGCAGWLVVTGQGSSDAQRYGELESLAAGPGIVASAKKRISLAKRSTLGATDLSKISAYDVAAAARQGDTTCQEVFQDIGRYLGHGVANLVSLFDPQIVILAGGMSGASDLFLAPLKKAMAEFAQPLAAKQVEIVVSKLAGDANLLGAARLAWEGVGGPRYTVHRGRR